MAKVSLRNEHDWLGFTISFADKTKAGVTWSRGAGEKVKVTPEDRKTERKLSILIWEASQRTKKGDAPYKNIGDIQKISAAAGEKSATAADFLSQLAGDLGVTGLLPKLDPGPAAKGAVATVKASRGGHVVTATFPTGEQAELTLNKSSVGIRLSPDITAYSQELTEFAFSAKGARVLDAADLAEAIRAAAESAGSVEEWIDAAREAVFPAPGLRR